MSAPSYPAPNVQELARRARHEIAYTEFPAREWVPPRQYEGEHVYDAVVVGGGQNGVTIAFGLMRDSVPNVLVVDRAPAGREGPWSNFARMHTLRTPKYVTGPDLGVPSLSVRSWYEAKFGVEAWAKLHKVPTDHWHDYLQWLRQTIGIAVRSDTEVHDIEPLAGGLLAVHTRSGQGGAQRFITRNVVLATGIEGSGVWHTPPMIAQSLPRDRYAHTTDQIDFAALKGKRVAVLGASASAFDNAACALEQGAKSVDAFVRRKTIPVLNPNRWMEYAGFSRHFADLPDPMRWRLMKLILDINQPPPQETFDRCTIFKNFSVHVGSPFEQVSMRGDTIVMRTPQGEYEADMLLVGTGLVIDFSLRPELARFVTQIATWADRYTPPPGEEDATLAGYPYLSDASHFTEKTPGAAPHLNNIFCFTFGAMASVAGNTGISMLKFSTARVVAGITRDLFVADAAAHFKSLQDYDEVSFDPAAPEPQSAAGAKDVAARADKVA